MATQSSTRLLTLLPVLSHSLKMPSARKKVHSKASQEQDEDSASSQQDFDVGLDESHARFGKGFGEERELSQSKPANKKRKRRRKIVKVAQKVITAFGKWWTVSQNASKNDLFIRRSNKLVRVLQLYLFSLKLLTSSINSSPTFSDTLPARK